MRKPRIATFTQEVLPTSSGGSCVLEQVESLADEYDFTVFATRFLSHRRPDTHFVPLGRERHPLGAQFWYAGFDRAADRQDLSDYDLIQSTQGRYARPDTMYAHFCHAAYVAEVAPKTLKGWRGAREKLLHQYLARREALALQTAQRIIAVSRALESELLRYYPQFEGRIDLIYNSIPSQFFEPANPADAVALRRQLGIPEEAMAFVMVALGGWERKGLRYAIEGLQAVAGSHLVVVGGSPGDLAPYRTLVEQEGLSQRVHMVGLQKDIRPYLDLANAMVLPTSYETFCLVCVQGMARGLPLLSTVVGGICEYLEDGVNGLVIERSRESVGNAYHRLASDRDLCQRIGQQARLTANRFSPEAFADAWRELLPKAIAERKR